MGIEDEECKAVDQEVKALCAERDKLRAEVELLTKHAKEGWNLAATQRTKAIDANLQIGVLKAALGKCFMACSVCDNGGGCDDHPEEMRDLLRTNGKCIKSVVRQHGAEGMITCFPCGKPLPCPIH